jgi:hypothetical protein
VADNAHLAVHNIQQRKVTEPDGRGGFGDFMRVAFTTASGTEAFVLMPMERYTAANVAAAIHKEASEIERVHALEGQALAPPVDDSRSPGA